MKKLLKKLLLLCLVLLFIAGCIKSIDPVTGEKRTQLDPNAVVVVEEKVEDAIEVGALMSAFFPFLAPIVTAAGGALLTYRKLYPKFTKAQSEATMYHTATEAAIKVVEDFKESNPDEWEKLKKKIHMTTKTENVIRAIRGLPPIL